MEGTATIILPVPPEVFLAFLAILVVSVIISVVRYIISIIMAG
jgi:hypothetical protein